MSPIQPLTLVLLGRKIGTYTSVDILPEAGLRIYDYQPAAESKIPAGDIFLDFGQGNALHLANGQTPSQSFDIIDSISACARVSEEEFKQIEEAAEVPQEDGK